MPAIRLYAAPGMGGPNGRVTSDDVVTKHVRVATTTNSRRCVTGEVVSDQAKYESIGRFIYNLYFKR